MIHAFPHHGKAFKAERRFRGKTIKIEVQNPSAVQKGIKELFLNGEKMTGNIVLAEKLKEKNTVLAIMG